MSRPRRIAFKVLLAPPRRTAAYLDSIAYVEGQFNQGFARTVVRLLKAFSEHFPRWAGDYAAISSVFQTIISNVQPDGSTRFPKLVSFGTRDAHLKSAARATHSLGLLLTTFDPDLTRDALDAMYAIYLSFWVRRQSLIREMAIVKDAVDRDAENPPPELALELRPKRAEDVVEQLSAFDNAVRYAYEIMMAQRGTRHLLVYAVSVLCVRIVSLQLQEQQESGQSYEEFFNYLRRPNSHMWLFFVELGLTISQNHLATSKLQTLYVAEAGTEPQMGVVAQGRFVRYLYRNRKVYGHEVRDQPEDVQAALRPPSYIWREFEVNCVWCFKEAHKECSACHRVRYCGRVCQNAHWNHSHRAACAIYPHLRQVIADSGVAREDA